MFVPIFKRENVVGEKGHLVYVLFYRTILNCILKKFHIMGDCCGENLILLPTHARYAQTRIADTMLVKLILFNTFAAKCDCSRIYRSLPNATTVEI